MSENPRDPDDRSNHGMVSAREESDALFRAELHQIATDNLLMHVDVGDAFANALASADMSLPSAASIEMMLTQEVDVSGSRDEIEHVLSLTDFDGLVIGGMRIDDLLGPQCDSDEIKVTVRRGVSFLKNSKYGVAAEWWELNMRTVSESNPRFYLLLSLLLVLTYQLSGDEKAAVQEFELVRRNHLYDLYKANQSPGKKA
jgi:hypothetical protein